MVIVLQAMGGRGMNDFVPNAVPAAVRFVVYGLFFVSCDQYIDQVIMI